MSKDTLRDEIECDITRKIIDIANSIKLKDEELEKEIIDYIYTLPYSKTGIPGGWKHSWKEENVIEIAKHFFNLGLKAGEKYIKDIPLQCWQIPCADPNYPCENPQMDCINCPRFGHPQGTITMTNMEE